MKKITILLLLTFTCASAFTQQKDLKTVTDDFDKILSGIKKDEPGVTALVARKGKVIYKKGVGMANMELDVPMQVNNVFKIGSITKQFTAIAILQLMEQEKLDLQDEITKFIPDYPTQGAKITIEHLLTHTSGIRDYSSIRDTINRGALEMTPKQMIDYFKNQPMRFAPGTKWEYSNSGYFLLGYIIEKITGGTYAEYIEQKIFTPLGMSASLYGSYIKLVKNRVNGYSKGKEGYQNASYLSMTHPYAGGSIQSTVEDMFKWNQALTDNKLVRKETLDKAFTRYKLIDGTPTNYGYGWRMGFIQESPSLWHGGLVNGFITMAMYLPKDDVFVAVLSNCDCFNPDIIMAKLAAVAIGKPYEYKAMPIANTELQAYKGVYENEKGLQRIFTVSGNDLYSQSGRGPKSQVKSYQKNHFYYVDDPMLSLEFKTNNRGEVENLVTKSRLAIETWKKVNKPIPSDNGIAVDKTILAQYVGSYELTPEMQFKVTLIEDKLFVQAPGQDKLEMFAESETKFFLKVNDAQLEFIKDGANKVTMIKLTQSGRSIEAKKVK